MLVFLPRDWEASLLPLDKLEVLATISHTISKDLATIMTGTATSLPEVAVLPSMDVAMLGLIVNIGLVGRWMEEGALGLDHQGSYPALCQVVVQAEADMGILLELLMAAFVPLLGARCQESSDALAARWGGRDARVVKESGPLLP